MALFSSTAWTGRSWAGGDVADAVTLPPPLVKSAKVQPRTPQPTRDGMLTEYAELAGIVGIPAPDLAIEAFKDFLRQKDWGVFSLAEVVAYMDKKAAAESKEQAGWHWRPLREKDHMLNAAFGNEAERQRDVYNSRSGPIVKPASDHYSGPHEYDSPEHVVVGSQWQATGRTVKAKSPSAQSVYDKTIPLHALRKVAAIEKEFKGGPISFFVCDYAPAPQIEHPDPFLMAAINNTKLAAGVGRFILDFWDEPGFGIEQSLK